MVLPCLMLDGFSTGWIWAGKGNAPVVALGLGTMLGHPQNGSVALGVQKAQLRAQGIKWGKNEVKMGWEMWCKAQPPTTDTSFPPATPPGGTIPPATLEVGDTQAWGAPGARGYSEVRCSGTSGGVDKAVGPTPLPALSHPGPRWWQVNDRRGPPPLGAPLGEVQPRGCWAEPFATYWLVWGVGALACAGVHPAPTSVNGCCAQVRLPPRQGGAAALPR